MTQALKVGVRLGVNTGCLEKGLGSGILGCKGSGAVRLRVASIAELGKNHHDPLPTSSKLRRLLVRKPIGFGEVGCRSCSGVGFS